MDQQRLDYLHRAYLDGSLTLAEAEEWQAILHSRAKEQRVKLLMEETWHNILPEERIVLARVQSDILFNQIIGKPEPKRMRLWQRVAVAAAIALGIGVGSLLYIGKDDKANNQQMVQLNDVAPGKNGATLTLANGKKIYINDALTGNIANEAGVKITKTKDGQLVYVISSEQSDEKSTSAGTGLNTLSTSNGETYQVRLPDGSLVWLNSGSSLTYATQLVQNGKRSVTLSGEAYFEVAKMSKDQGADVSSPNNKKLTNPTTNLPFIVKTAGQQVEVLGTHFNVNAYADEPLVATTLLEGSVRVSAGNNARLIAPGEQLRNAGGQFVVTKVNTANITDWKEGEFNLDETDFRVAMRKIARWYDVEVIYKKSVPMDIESFGWISRESKLSAVLKLIENSGQVKFRVEGKKVYVYK